MSFKHTSYFNKLKYLFSFLLFWLILNKTLLSTYTTSATIDLQSIVPIDHRNRLTMFYNKCRGLGEMPLNSGQMTTSPVELTKTRPWLDTTIFPVESESLMFCSIPKIASKTLISLITYVHVRNILKKSNNNFTEIHVNRGTLTLELLKVGLGYRIGYSR